MPSCFRRSCPSQAERRKARAIPALPGALRQHRGYNPQDSSASARAKIAHVAPPRLSSGVGGRADMMPGRVVVPVGYHTSRDRLPLRWLTRGSVADLIYVPGICACGALAWDRSLAIPAPPCPLRVVPFESLPGAPPEASRSLSLARRRYRRGYDSGGSCASAPASRVWSRAQEEASRPGTSCPETLAFVPYPTANPMRSVRAADPNPAQPLSFIHRWSIAVGQDPGAKPIAGSCSAGWGQHPTPPSPARVCHFPNSRR